MATTADRLALLQRTKAGQRALLEEMYPDLDFSTVPFREYGRLFTGRKYVPGFVGGWKGYGRSNAEDPATREILPDYSGNGRDIRLYNFAFSGMSGWGGYVQDSYDLLVRTNHVDNWTVTAEGSIVHVKFNIDTRTSLQFAYGLVSNFKPGDNIIRAGVFGLKVYSTDGGGANEQLLLELKPNQVGSFNIANVSQEYIMYKVYEPAPANSTMEIEFLPTYPGALVSDGIDDYGQCIKGFALSDDYTVVAIRKILKGNNGGLASKGGITGAFLFDAGLNDVPCWSYGKGTSVGSDFRPALFSYQTKLSYNGQAIGIGDETDSSDDIFYIFKQYKSHPDCESAALYDLRIYDHSLTDEELQIVKDEMMSEYEKNAKPLDGITYVADWDAKGRSNDEDADVRDKWVDKATGKTIDLNNFAYAGMSGWNGYATDFIENNWIILDNTVYQKDLVTVGSVSLRFKGLLTGGHTSCGISLPNGRIPKKATTYRLRVTGIKENQIVRIRNESMDPLEQVLLREDGILELEVSKGTASAGSLFIYFTSSNAVNPDVDVTIEQLPLYPGALVGDGVDDYGVTQEAINEEVGTMLVYARLIDESNEGYYILNTNNSSGDNGRLYLWRTGSGRYGWGLPTKSGDNPPFILTREPLAPNLVMYIASSSPGYYSACFVHRIILIREQLDGAQVEFLKWKVEKEYRDWCRANGYEYAINQLTA